MKNDDNDRKVAIARRIAETLGDDYDTIPANKAEWTAARGIFSGSHRDINSPFREDYDEAAATLLGEFPLAPQPDVRIAELEAELTRTKQALALGAYYYEQNSRYRKGLPVRDLAEAEGAFRNALASEGGNETADHVNLIARCRDLVEWWDKGTCPNGPLREYGEQLTAPGAQYEVQKEPPGSPRVAEMRTTDEAVRFIASLPGAHAVTEPRVFGSLTEAIQALGRGSHFIRIGSQAFNLVLGPRDRIDFLQEATSSKR